MLNNIYIWLHNSFIDFLFRISEMNLFYLSIFLSANKYILLFILITYILILFDKRFKLKSKVYIFFFLFFFLFFLFIYKYNDLNRFFQELYLYNLILNFSFIIHVCWLHWIYEFFWKRRNEKICWIISRIAFVFSLGFIVLLINTLYCYIRLFAIKNKNFLSKHLYLDACLFLFWKSLLIIAVILRFFMIIFMKYTDLILGNTKLIKITFYYLIIFIIYISFTIWVSYFILNINRLIFHWCLLFFYWFYRIISFYLEGYKISFPGKINWKEFCWRLVFIEIDLVIWRNLELYQFEIFIKEEMYNKNYIKLYDWPHRSALILTIDHIFVENTSIKKVWNLIFIDGLNHLNRYDLVHQDLFSPFSCTHEDEMKYVFYLKEKEAKEKIFQTSVDYNLTNEEYLSLLNYYYITKPYKWHIINKYRSNNGMEELSFL